MIDQIANALEEMLLMILKTMKQTIKNEITRIQVLFSTSLEEFEERINQRPYKHRNEERNIEDLKKEIEKMGGENIKYQSY